MLHDRRGPFLASIARVSALTSLTLRGCHFPSTSALHALGRLSALTRLVICPSADRVQVGVGVGVGVRVVTYVSTVVP